MPGETDSEAAAEGRSPLHAVRGWVDARMARVRTKRWWRWARWPIGAVTTISVLLVVLLIGLYLTVQLPKDPPVLSSSVILDDQGRELAVLAKDGQRFAVKLDQVAPVVVDALLSTEDRRFFDHGGIDPVGMARAFVNDLRGGATQGGSTITQQLVKNSYLNTDRSLVRKVKEAILAMKLEQREDKRSILERYLNIVYFGRGAYGVEAAARTYFGVDASALTAPQAALLVGLLRAPESADPASDPAEAKRRRDTVLQNMVNNKKLSQAEADTAKAAPLGAEGATRPVTLSAGVAPYFVEWVRQQAIERFGAAAVYGGGLRIHTTLDLDAQKAAEQAVASVLTSADDPQAALVAADRDGNIRAYVGGRDYTTLKVDLARGKAGGGSGRQPGSAFKPFTLAAALEKGTTLAKTFPAPPSITLQTDSGPWKVQNYGNEGFGTLDLTTATAHSVNTVYAQLMLDTGPAAVAALASRAGITSPLEAVPSLTLGTDEVSPLELTDAYLTFAREGQQVPLSSIAKVEDAGGNVLYEPPAPKPVPAMQQGTAQAVTHALQHVVTEGTGTAAQLGRPVAGKTGTTEDYGDAWFAGYTPSLVATVWVGYPEGRSRTMADVGGSAVTGGTLPARIWNAFMTAVLANVPPEDFAPPPASYLRPAPASQQVAETVPTDSTTTSGPTTSTTAPAPGRTTTTTTAPPKPPKATTTTTTTTTTSPPATTTTTIAPAGTSVP